MMTNEFFGFLDLLSFYHDPYDKDHRSNTVAMARALATATGYPEERIDTLSWAAQLHDVGKLLIPESVLNKQGKLTRIERATIRKHVEVGYDVVNVLKLDPIVAEAILEHHECWDGTGYPRGLRGERICIEGRIIAICDSFDAMTSDRSYRKRMTAEKSLEVMSIGEIFDPALLKVFIDKQIFLEKVTQP